MHSIPECKKSSGQLFRSEYQEACKTDSRVLLEAVPDLEEVLCEPLLRQRDAVDPDSFTDGDQMRRGIQA